jgi:hypothetical protein
MRISNTTLRCDTKYVCNYKTPFRRNLMTFLLLMALAFIVVVALDIADKNRQTSI